MIVIPFYAHKRVAVFGLGRTGLSAVRALVAGGAEVLAWDDDPERRDRAESLGGRAVAPEAKRWQGVRAVVLSPGVPLTHPQPHPVVRLAQKLGAEVLGDVELFARTRPAGALVAVTGTNGKSTTTALIAHALNTLGRPAQAGANLGLPVLEFEPPAAESACVLELSSYQIDLTRSLRPDIAVLINLSADHLDRHGGMAGYIAAKRRLFTMNRAATCVLGVDDPWSAGIADQHEALGQRVLRVGLAHPPANGYGAGEGWLRRYRDGVGEDLVELAGIDSLQGRHNAQNAACALAVLEALGFEQAAIGAALATFPGLDHRMQPLPAVDGVRFVNDSKATNAEAASHALSTYSDIYWIAGGRAKEGGIESLRPLFPRIRRCFLIGEAEAAFAATLGAEVPHERCGTLERAVAQAFAAARADGGSAPVVLLSPACASFDQFPSFEARGARFAELAAGLSGGDAPARRAAAC